LVSWEGCAWPLGVSKRSQIAPLVRRKRKARGKRKSPTKGVQKERRTQQPFPSQKRLESSQAVKRALTREEKGFSGGGEIMAA